MAQVASLCQWGQGWLGRDAAMQEDLLFENSGKHFCELALVLFCLLIWLPGFFSLPPGDRDESRFAQASKQMIESGDYVTIRNGAEARNKKPIGIYWLQVPGAALAGPGLANPIWPYRLPSLLGGIAAVLAVFQIARSFGQTRRGATLAAAMLAGCVILTTETHIAKTDAALLGATTIAMAILARAWTLAPLPRWQAALFWLALGAGILIKGPITPMIVGLASGTLCLWSRRAGWLAPLRPAWGAPLLLAIVMPWFIAIALATHGRFFTDAVGGDLGNKLAGGSETHGGFFGLHLLLMPLLAFPSTVLVIASLPALWAGRAGKFEQFLIAWVVPAWLVFEAVPTKLPHYTLPLYPALFLAAGSLAPAASVNSPLWARLIGRAGLLVAGTFLCASALALPILLGAAWWLGLPAAFMAALTTWLAWRPRIETALLAAIGLYAALLWIELPHVPSLWIAPRVEAALRQDWPGWNLAGRGLAVAGYAEPSLMFLAGTQTQFLASGAAAAAALAAGRASIVLVTDRDLPGFNAAAAALGLHPRQRAAIRGFNYSRGRWVELLLIASGKT